MGKPKRAIANQVQMEMLAGKKSSSTKAEENQDGAQVKNQPNRGPGAPDFPEAAVPSARLCA